MKIITVDEQTYKHTSRMVDYFPWILLFHFWVGVCLTSFSSPSHIAIKRLPSIDSCMQAFSICKCSTC